MKVKMSVSLDWSSLSSPTPTVFLLKRPSDIGHIWDYIGSTIVTFNSNSDFVYGQLGEGWVWFWGPGACFGSAEIHSHYQAETSWRLGPYRCKA